jgi:uncharacterized protein YuzE
MRLHYYPETDSLYIDLNSQPAADSQEVAEGLVVDFDAQGNVVGIDIDHASTKLDLNTLEYDGLKGDNIEPVAWESRPKPRRPIAA